MAPQKFEMVVEGHMTEAEILDYAKDIVEAKAGGDSSAGLAETPGSQKIRIVISIEVL